MADIQPIPRRSKIRRISGKKNRLTVIGFHGFRTKKCGKRETLWLFLCDCGKETITSSSRWLSGQTKSCGCLLGSTERSVRAMEHGHAGKGRLRSSEYQTWNNMRQRCCNEKGQQYEDYGGRGIKICDGWLYSFESFIADMGLKPGKEYSIDRIDNNRGYDCGHCDDCKARVAVPNCRWATRDQQLLNRRNSHLITAFGTTLTASEWSRKTGLSRQGIINRIEIHWYTPEEAVSLPNSLRHLDNDAVRLARSLSAEGVSNAKIAKMLGVSQPTIGRLLRGEIYKDVL